MRILYVAKHGSGGNDDEGSIAFALEQIGHEVTRVQEYRNVPIRHVSARYDFCLFHKWCEPGILAKMECPKVFWYFDLVDWPSDPSLRSRCEARKKWMADVIPLVDVGFCTDGDWVERCNLGERFLASPENRLGKLVTLRQGADERVVGFGKEQPRDIDVLFVGICKGGGVRRESFCKELHDHCNRRGYVYAHFAKGVYREALCNLAARAKVVVCPDSPVTDRYWSNRVYTLGGFGACLLHPRVTDPELPLGVLMYSGRDKLMSNIDSLLRSDGDRQIVANAAMRDIKESHLYRHRCEEMIRVLREREIVR